LKVESVRESLTDTAEMNGHWDDAK